MKINNLNITQKDIKTFEAKLIEAAQAQSEIEVNVKNAQRGYILFGQWFTDYSDLTAEEFASRQVSLVLDGADCVAAL